MGEGTGEQLGQYRIVGELGRGIGMVVQEAVHTWTGRRVAIKRQPAELSKDGLAAERFLREARVAGHLLHPHVVSTIDMDVDHTGCLYVVQELLEGESLDTYLEGRGPVHPTTTLDIVLPILDALVAAHAVNIIHRNVKPSSIFLAKGDRGATVPKLLGFGFSKLLGNHTSPSALTYTGSDVGSPRYRSPEQFRRDHAVGVRTDVWSIGVVLFEMLAGRRPFHGASLHELGEQIVHGRAPSLGDVAPDVPTWITQAVDYALVREAEQRLPDVEMFVHLLTTPDATVPPHVRELHRSAAGARVPPDEDEIDGLAETPMTPVRISRQVIVAGGRANAETISEHPPALDDERLQRPDTVTDAVAYADELDDDSPSPDHDRFIRAPTPASGVDDWRRKTTRSAPLRFGVVALNPVMNDPRLPALITEAAGQSTVLIQLQDYASLAVALAEDEVDAALFGPLAAAHVMRMPSAKPLVALNREAAGGTAAALVARAPFQNDVPLSEQRAVWVDPWSAAGYAVGRKLLVDRGADLSNGFASEGFVRSHEAVISALLHGSADIGACACMVGRDGGAAILPWRDQTAIELLAVSAPLPPEVVCVSAALSAARSGVLSDALRTAHSYPSGAELLEMMGAEAFSDVNTARYDALLESVADVVE